MKHFWRSTTTFSFSRRTTTSTLSHGTLPAVQMRKKMSARGQNEVNLFLGWPNPGLLPPDKLKEASAAALSDRDISTPALLYGPDDGFLPLRHEVAEWLTSFYKPKDHISHQRICITGGASQNLACLLQTFTDPLYTRNVWMVAPTYYLACRIFDDSGFAGKLRGVPEDREGIDVDFLSKQLQLSEKKAVAEGNLEPVRIPYRGLNPPNFAKCHIAVEIETLKTLEENLQACYLCSTYVRKPVRSTHELGQTNSISSSCPPI